MKLTGFTGIQQEESDKAITFILLNPVNPVKIFPHPFQLKLKVSMIPSH